MTTHTRPISKYMTIILGIALLILSLIFFVLPSKASGLSSTDVKFSSVTTLTGETIANANIQLLDAKGEVIIRTISNKVGQFTLKTKFKDGQDYTVRVKKGDKTHAFPVTFDEYAVQNNIEVGAGFLSSDDD